MVTQVWSVAGWQAVDALAFACIVFLGAVAIWAFANWPRRP
jgi:hypothetical protein